MKNLKFVSGLILICTSLQLFAANPTGRSIQVGFRFNVGYINEFLPEKQHYQPILILGFYQHDFKSASEKGNFSLYFEPQFNPVLIEKKLSNFEFGFNFGIQYTYKFNENNMIYGAIGSGPHYINAVTRLQAKGFIFSDNFILGYKHQVKNGVFLDVNTRFRHISNAGLQKPNTGIDNFLCGLGISREFNIQ